MKKCNYCGAQVADDSLFCTECGKRIDDVTETVLFESTKTKCPHCGASVNVGDIFCTECGKKIDETSTIITETSVNTDSENVAETPKTGFTKKLLTIISCIIVVAILFGGSWYGFNVYKEYAKAKEIRNKFVKDSLEKVRQDSIKLAAEMEAKRLETEKLAKFREKFTVKNILNMLNHPDDKSIANKCGLTFSYTHTYTIEAYENEFYQYKTLVYGTDIGDIAPNPNELGKFIVKATSSHSCYCAISDNRYAESHICFNNKADADYFIEMLKEQGFTKWGDVYTNQSWGFFIPDNNDGWYEMVFRQEFG